MGFAETLVIFSVAGCFLYMLVGGISRLIGSSQSSKPESLLSDERIGDLEHNPVKSDSEYMLSIECDDHLEALEEFDRKLNGEVDDQIGGNLKPHYAVNSDTLEMLFEYLYRRTYEGGCPWEGKETGITTDVFVCEFEWKNGEQAKVWLTKTYNEHPRFELRFQYPSKCDASMHDDFLLLDGKTDSKKAKKLWSIAYDYAQTGTSARAVLDLQQDLKGWQ